MMDHVKLNAPKNISMKINLKYLNNVNNAMKIVSNAQEKILIIVQNVKAGGSYTIINAK